MNTIEYYGAGSLSHIKNILKEVNPKKVFLVTGKKSFQASGAADILLPILSNYSHQIFNDFDPNPKLVDIQKGIALFDDDVELVISIGGGSVIDVGKSINILQDQKGEPVDYILKIML